MNTITNIYTVKEAQKNWDKMWRQIKKGNRVLIRHKKKYFLFVKQAEFDRVKGYVENYYK